MAFGFAPPLQPRPMMMPAPMSFPTMNLTQSGPAGYIPQPGGGKPTTFGDIKSGLQKLMGGQPPGAASPDQQAYGSAVTNVSGPVSYTPPSGVDQMNMGPMMGGAMDGAAAGSGAAAGAGADAAGAAGSAAAGDAAAGASGADIGSFIAALLGL